MPSYPAYSDMKVLLGYITFLTSDDLLHDAPGATVAQFGCGENLTGVSIVSDKMQFLLQISFSTSS